MFDSSRMRPIEFFIVATDADNGNETWFRTIRIQGFSESKLADAIVTGNKYDSWYWRKEPAKYRIVTRSGQEFRARWNQEKRAFVVIGLDVMFSRKECKEIWEYSE